MGFNFTSVKARINKIISDLLADEGLAVTITHKKDLGVVWSDEFKRNVASTSDTSMPAIRTKHNRRSVQVSGSGVEEGDIVYFVQNSDMPSIITLNDRIVEGANSYRIKNIQDLFGVAYIVTVYSGS